MIAQDDWDMMVERAVAAETELADLREQLSASSERVSSLQNALSLIRVTDGVITSDRDSKLFPSGQLGGWRHQVIADHALANARQADAKHNISAGDVTARPESKNIAASNRLTRMEIMSRPGQPTENISKPVGSGSSCNPHAASSESANTHGVGARHCGRLGCELCAELKRKLSEKGHTDG